MIISAVTMAEEPEFISFLKRKFKTDGKHKHHDSRSAQKDMLSRFEMEGRYSNLGLARKPASI